MLRKISGIVGVGLAGMTFGSVGMAAEGGASSRGVTVTTGAASMKVGGEFRSEFLYDDNGLSKTSAFKPDKTTKVAVSAVNLVLGGNVNKDTEYGFRFNLLNPSQSNGPLDYGYGTHWFTKALGFSIGKMRVMQGGWDHMDGDYRTHAAGIFNDRLVYRDFDNMFTLNLRLAGELKLQVVNDVTVPASATATRAAGATAGGEWNKSAHPTTVVGWTGHFGPIQPLVDFGSYDNNKSSWGDLSLKASMACVDATVGAYFNKMVHANKKSDTLTAYTMNVACHIKGAATPWVYVSTFSTKEDSDLAYNTLNADGSVNWDDNSSTWGLGADLEMFGKGWNPFVAVVGNSGKFQKAAGDTNNTETRSNVQVKLGVLAEI